MTELFIPSPSQGVWHLGPIPVRGYALSILAGILVAWWLSMRRWKARGGRQETLESILVWAIVAGIVGARIYYVIIEWPRYFGSQGTWYHVFFIWQGGLGIWGAVTFGALAVWWRTRTSGVTFTAVADTIAPGLILAQGMGRLGNWWNQELYGRPTTLPWGLKIDLAHRVPGYEQFATFHPTFLYEMLWNFAMVGVLLWAERRFRLGRGKLFALYVVFYAAGRSVTESLRIDPVHVIAGLRVNLWVTITGGVLGLVWLAWLVKFRPGQEIPVQQPAGEPAATPH